MKYQFWCQCWDISGVIVLVKTVCSHFFFSSWHQFSVHFFWKLSCGHSNILEIYQLCISSSLTRTGIQAISVGNGCLPTAPRATQFLRFYNYKLKKLSNHVIILIFKLNQTVKSDVTTSTL